MVTTDVRSVAHSADEILKAGDALVSNAIDQEPSPEEIEMRKTLNEAKKIASFTLKAAAHLEQSARESWGKTTEWGKELKTSTYEMEK